MFSNGVFIEGLNLGRLSKAIREASTKFKTTRSELSCTICMMDSFSVLLIHARLTYMYTTHAHQVLTQLQMAPKNLWGRSGYEKRSGMPNGVSIMLRICPTCVLININACIWCVQSRCYPPGFCQRLLECWQDRGEYSGNLRHKFPVDLNESDKDIWKNMPIGDIWLDGELHHVWFYLMGNKQLCIPDSWYWTVMQFDHELSALEARLREGQGLEGCYIEVGLAFALGKEVFAALGLVVSREVHGLQGRAPLSIRSVWLY